MLCFMRNSGGDWGRRMVAILSVCVLALPVGGVWASPPKDTATERFLRDNNEWTGRLDPQAMTSRKARNYQVRGLAHLHVAAQLGDLETARWLLDNGAKLEARSRADFTPLFMAAAHNQDGMVEFLLDRGADAHVTVGIRLGLMHLAASRGVISTAEILLRAGVDINAKNLCGYTPLDFAVVTKRPEMEKWLRDNGAKCGRNC